MLGFRVQLEEAKEGNVRTCWQGSIRQRRRFQDTFACSSSSHHFSTNMNVSVVALAILIAAFCYQTSAAPLASDPPTSCCFTYVARQLPRSFVKDYYETNSQCSQPAVVFITKKGREVCANPSQDWVQQYMNELELN
ncbi:C-C motif chemokine 4 like protein [Turdus rufiventris]|nr:C-C motif chemokine 4 like protein [Turdus rufiventris]